MEKTLGSMMIENPMNRGSIADAFLANRAELLPPDVWGKFIVPQFFKRISIFQEAKSIRIQGGRGCGKTMFIRYFCHQTQFSNCRQKIPDNELSRIGLYWRPDTQFCGLMKETWLGERDAQLAFTHYATLVILEELASSIESIAHADFEGGKCDLTDLVLPAAVRLALGERVTKVAELREFAETERVLLELWVQNPDATRPTMLRFDRLLEQIGNHLSEQDTRLKNVLFRIFVDEFENLQEIQRKLICDFVKHPGRRYCLNFAMRRHAVSQFYTSGGEQIVETHDVRTIDIERELGKKEREFTLLAAEMLLLKLHERGVDFTNTLFCPKKLVDPNHLEERTSDAYCNEILSHARAIFPSITPKAIAQTAFEDNALMNRLKSAIEKGLAKHKSKIPVASFLRSSVPEASIVAVSVLNRNKPGPEEVLRELDIAERDDPKMGRFYKPGGWIENNLYGSLFYLYIGLPRRPNLLYSGFDRFCSLSSPNLRFFQELVHGALLLAFERKSIDSIPAEAGLIVSEEIQAEAAKQVSETLLLEIEHLGLKGSQLLQATRRLGRIFEVAHRRASQSEPEINHFSIDESDRVALSEEAKELLVQAKIWSVLYEEQDTKNKSNYDIAQTDIVPNPIFSPYFGISYRKKRKLTLSAAQVNTLMTGSGAQFEQILKEFAAKWDVTESALTVNKGLFD